MGAEVEKINCEWVGGFVKFIYRRIKSWNFKFWGGGRIPEYGRICARLRYNIYKGFNTQNELPEICDELTLKWP